MGTEIQIATQAGTIARREFGGEELASTAETASSAVAAQAKAAIEARYVMALRRPRDLDGVRIRLLAECRRKGFADAAIYSKPVGGKHIEGPSVRFAEAAIRCMGNILPETATIYDDASKRIVRQSVTDLESNVTYTKDIMIEKVVERSSLKDGQTAISERTNSTGKKTYLVTATEDALLTKEGAFVSKAVRTLALRILPGDILDECMDLCRATLKDQAAKDPAGERKKLADVFASLGVQPEALKSYLGHALDACTPTELVELRKVYSTLRDGETSWQDVMETRHKATMATSSAPAAVQAVQVTQADTEKSQAADIANAAEVAQSQPKEEPKEEPAPLEKPADSDPLAEFRAALAAATTKSERIKAMRLVAGMPPELQPKARELFNAGAGDASKSE